MKVIFTKEVPGTGHRGDIKEVADGYALNFLFPQKVALPATDGNIKSMSLQKKSAEVKILKQAKSAKELAKQLQGFRLELKAKADEKGTLFGGVNDLKISQALAKAGFEIKPEQVKLAQAVKSVGNHPVKLQLDNQASAQILLVVIKE